MKSTISHYTGGNAGWGTMVCECTVCGEVVAEYECDDLGRITKAIFNYEDDHDCEEVFRREEDETDRRVADWMA